MALAAEDSLRLHVLLANQPLALRLDERTLTLHALTAQGELQCTLHPNASPEAYLKQVRELLSGQVLDSPGGYPVFLKRWTRMGQARDEHLPQLLLLGEPEAIVAVVCAAGLTDELARRAWWVMPEAENARRMLARSTVTQGLMGPVLAQYLGEHLAFETDPLTIMRTVQLMLQPRLLPDSAQQALWHQAERQTPCRVGFLAAGGAAVPNLLPAHTHQATWAERLQPLADSGNQLAQLMLLIHTSEGQTYFYQVAECLRHPVNPELVDALLEVIATYCARARPADVEADTDLEQIQARLAEQRVQPEVQALLARIPELEAQWRALALLAQLNYGVVRDIFAQGNAEGTLLARKLAPVSTVLLAQLGVLMGQAWMPNAASSRRRGANALF